jgi:hypothetical protein
LKSRKQQQQQHASASGPSPEPSLRSEVNAWLATAHASRIAPTAAAGDPNAAESLPRVLASLDAIRRGAKLSNTQDQVDRFLRRIASGVEDDDLIRSSGLVPPSRGLYGRAQGHLQDMASATRDTVMSLRDTLQRMQPMTKLADFPEKSFELTPQGGLLNAGDVTRYRGLLAHLEYVVSSTAMLAATQTQNLPAADKASLAALERRMEQAIQNMNAAAAAFRGNSPASAPAPAPVPAPAPAPAPAPVPVPAPVPAPAPAPAPAPQGLPPPPATIRIPSTSPSLQAPLPPKPSIRPVSPQETQRLQNYDALVAEVAQRRREYEELREEHVELLAQYGDQKLDMARVTRELNDSASALNALRRKYEAKKRDLQRARNGLLQTIRALQNTRANLNIEKASAARWRAALQTMSQDLGDIQREANTLAAPSVDAAAVAAPGLEATITQLQQELKDRLGPQRARVRQLERDLAEALTAKESAESLLSASVKDSQYKTTLKQLRDAESARRSAETQVKDLESKQAALKALHASRLKDLKSEIREAFAALQGPQRALSQPASLQGGGQALDAALAALQSSAVKGLQLAGQALKPLAPAALALDSKAAVISAMTAAGKEVRTTVAQLQGAMRQASAQFQNQRQSAFTQAQVSQVIAKEVAAMEAAQDNVLDRLNSLEDFIDFESGRLYTRLSEHNEAIEDFITNSTQTTQKIRAAMVAPPSATPRPVSSNEADRLQAAVADLEQRLLNVNQQWQALQTQPPATKDLEADVAATRRDIEAAVQDLQTRLPSARTLASTVLAGAAANASLVHDAITTTKRRQRALTQTLQEMASIVKSVSEGQVVLPAGTARDLLPQAAYEALQNRVQLLRGIMDSSLNTIVAQPDLRLLPEAAKAGTNDALQASLRKVTTFSETCGKATSSKLDKLKAKLRVLKEKAASDTDDDPVTMKAILELRREIDRCKNTPLIIEHLQHQQEKNDAEAQRRKQDEANRALREEAGRKDDTNKATLEDEQWSTLQRKTASTPQKSADNGVENLQPSDREQFMDASSKRPAPGVTRIPVENARLPYGLRGGDADPVNNLLQAGEWSSVVRYLNHPSTIQVSMDKPRHRTEGDKASSVEAYARYSMRLLIQQHAILETLNRAIVMLHGSTVQTNRLLLGARQRYMYGSPRIRSQRFPGAGNTAPVDTSERKDAANDDDGVAVELLPTIAEQASAFLPRPEDFDARWCAAFEETDNAILEEMMAARVQDVYFDDEVSVSEYRTNSKLKAIFTKEVAAFQEEGSGFADMLKSTWNREGEFEDKLSLRELYAPYPEESPRSFWASSRGRMRLLIDTNIDTGKDTFEPGVGSKRQETGELPGIHGELLLACIKRLWYTAPYRSMKTNAQRLQAVLFIGLPDLIAELQRGLFTSGALSAMKLAMMQGMEAMYAQMEASLGSDLVRDLKAGLPRDYDMQYSCTLVAPVPADYMESARPAKATKEEVAKYGTTAYFALQKRQRAWDLQHQRLMEARKRARDARLGPAYDDKQAMAYPVLFNGTVRKALSRVSFANLCWQAAAVMPVISAHMSSRLIEARDALTNEMQYAKLQQLHEAFLQKAPALQLLRLPNNPVHNFTSVFRAYRFYMELSRLASMYPYLSRLVMGLVGLGKFKADSPLALEKEDFELLKTWFPGEYELEAAWKRLQANGAAPEAVAAAKQRLEQWRAAIAPAKVEARYESDASLLPRSYAKRESSLPPLHPWGAAPKQADEFKEAAEDTDGLMQDPARMWMRTTESAAAAEKEYQDAMKEYERTVTEAAESIEDGTVETADRGGLLSRITNYASSWFSGKSE